MQNVTSGETYDVMIVRDMPYINPYDMCIVDIYSATNQTFRS